MKRLFPFLLLLAGLVACDEKEESGPGSAALAISEVEATTTSVSFYLTATRAVACAYAVTEDPDALTDEDLLSAEVPPGRMTRFRVGGLEPDREYTIVAVAVGADGSRCGKRHRFVTTARPTVKVCRVEPGYDDVLLTVSATNADLLHYACVEKGAEAPSEYFRTEVAETIPVCGLFPAREYTVYLLAEREGVRSEMPVTCDFRTEENLLSLAVEEIIPSVSSVSLRIRVTAADALYYLLAKSVDPEPAEELYLRQEIVSGNDVVELTVPGLLSSQSYVLYLFVRNAYGQSAVVRTDAFETDCENLSEKGRANCYLITTTDPVKYKFDATLKGCSSVPVGAFVSADLLWADAPGLIASVAADPETGTVSFVCAGRGNGLIAVRDADGGVLWSWHIWCAGGPVGDDVCINFTGSSPVLMDRNLGAVSADPYSEASHRCMLYQWGRKDPFPNFEAVYVGEDAVSTTAFLDRWPAVAADGTGDAANNNLLYAVRNPTRFLSGPAGWFPAPGAIGAENTTADLWGNKLGAATKWNGSEGWWSGEKTMYDPCPAGYRVPGVYVVSGFTATGGDYGNNAIDPATQLNLIDPVFNDGWLFRRTGADSEGAWYPATGCRQNATGACAEPSCIYLWFSGHNTSSPTAVPGTARALYATGNKFRAATFGKVYAFGCPVRCQRIPDAEE